MARGDYADFEEAALYFGSGLFDLTSDTIKVGLVDDTITPSADDGTPT